MPNTRNITRAVGLAIGALVALGGSSAFAEDKASLRLDWILNGHHPAYYLGVERGFYKDAGIDLTINEGRGSGVAVQLVANGDDTFGIADTSAVIAGKSKGAPVVVIMSIFAKSNLGVIAREDSGITDVKSLVGKKVAATPGDALTPVFPALLAANGVDQDDVEMVFMDAAAKPAAFLAGQTDALLGGIDDQPYILEAQGVKTKVLNFGDYGMNALSNSAVTSTDLIKSNPDLVKRFVEASTRSWKAAMEDPEAAVDAALKSKQGADRDILLAQFKASIALMGVPEGKPLGWASDEIWDQTLDIMKTYRGLETDVPASDFHDYSFLVAE